MPFLLSPKDNFKANKIYFKKIEIAFQRENIRGVEFLQIVANELIAIPPASFYIFLDSLYAPIFHLLCFEVSIIHASAAKSKFPMCRMKEISVF